MDICRSCDEYDRELWERTTTSSRCTTSWMRNGSTTTLEMVSFLRSHCLVRQLILVVRRILPSTSRPTARIAAHRIQANRRQGFRRQRRLLRSEAHDSRSPAIRYLVTSLRLICAVADSASPFRRSRHRAQRRSCVDDNQGRGDRHRYHPDDDCRALYLRSRSRRKGQAMYYGRKSSIFAL